MQQSAEIGKKARYDYIDILRVFSICFVIVLHTIGDYFYAEHNYGSTLWWCLGFANELSRTGVPLFFMISGFLLLKRDIPDIKEFYKHRFTKICIPLVGYSIFYFAVDCIQTGEVNIRNFFSGFLNSGYEYHLWFMYSLAFLYLMIPFVKMIIERCNTKMLIGVFLFVIFHTTLRPFVNTVFDGYISIYLNDDGICGYLGYVILGYILGTYDIPPLAKRLIYAATVISFVAFPVISMYWAAEKGTISMFNGGYFLNHYIEAAGIFLFFKEKVNIKIKFVSALSVLVMDAYFIHAFALDGVRSIAWNVSPSALIVVQVSLAIILSFLWAFIKNKSIKCVKCVKGVYKNV